MSWPAPTLGLMSDDTPLWLFADQLGPAVHGGEHAHREVLLVEAASALTKRRYHRQKLHLRPVGPAAR
ncbi:Uncharacterised protein [Mycolicibacterium vanbaalenii]|uniref:Uncharacterized protein n=1 Tax=Mycolicibacterium vanbaalenii TaxID=110539 RepID=A0A5S9QRW1_MYCVN|nr:Uncharacterised protein [Mycolicibacterium vanbaalenii]